MSHQSNEEQGGQHRREILKVAGAAAAAGLLGVETASGQTARPGTRDDGPLGGRLQGVRHFGVTVQNIDRAFAFYTEVLGGTEIMRDGDFKGVPVHHTLMADQEIVARERRVDPRTIGVPDLGAALSGSMSASSSSRTSSSNCCSIAMPRSRWAAATAGPSCATT